MTIAAVAQRWVLQQRAVGAVIVGARLGHSGWVAHIEENKRVFAFYLDEEDLKAIEGVQRRGSVLRGDCGDEYR